MRRYLSTEPVRLSLVRAKVTDEEKRAIEAVARERKITVAALIRSLIPSNPDKQQA